MLLANLINHNDDENKKIWKQNENSECAAHFFAIILPLMLSNFTEMAMWSCDP